ncbi:hypothetical protein ACLB2K_050350 [Fragaria x ananassa]
MRRFRRQLCVAEEGSVSFNEKGLRARRGEEETGEARRRRVSRVKGGGGRRGGAEVRRRHAVRLGDGGLAEARRD